MDLDFSRFTSAYCRRTKKESTIDASGALMRSAGTRLRGPAIPVKIASTVGAGDSFLAAMVWGLASGATLDDAFRHGIAAGTAALLAPGTNLARKRETEELARLVELRSL